MHNEELAASGIRKHSTCHGENTRGMCQVIFEPILRKFSFDRVARASHAGSVWTAALNHEATDNTVKNQTVIEDVLYKTDEFVYCIWGDFWI